MTNEDFGWVSIPIGWLVCVCDSNIKDRSLAAGPKAMNGKITTEFRGRFGVGGISQLHISTW
jgi:hypothetical protein